MIDSHAHGARAAAFARGFRSAVHVWRDPYGSFLPMLWWSDWHDARAGRTARRAARWGYVKPPPTRGRVIWLVAGASHDSVRLGAELLRGLRDKRLDVRLVLTFEAEYPDLLARLEGLDKCGWGFGACDHPRAVERIVTRLDPYGVIFCGGTPRPHLARRLQDCAHQLVVGAAAPAHAMHVERVYPADPQQAMSWPGHVCAPSADLLTLVTEAQVDPNFRALVNGGRERHLWWYHGDDLRSQRRFIERWRAALGSDVLFVSGRGCTGYATVHLGAWRRTPLPNGSIAAVDVPRWLPAIAASVTGAHLQAPSASLRWQALAGGAALSLSEVPPEAMRADAFETCADASAVLAHWAALRANPILARQRGDAARRAFWAARRAAADMQTELFERVFEW